MNADLQTHYRRMKELMKKDNAEGLTANEKKELKHLSTTGADRLTDQVMKSGLWDSQHTEPDR